MIAAMALIAGCGGGSDKQAAPSGGKVTLKMAAHLPQSHPLVKAMQDLKAKTAEKSGGTLDIQIYPAGQLFNDKNMNDALISGGVDMGLNTVGRWASIVPAMDVFDLPFLFPTYEKIGKDFAGLKIRGYSKYSTETIKALGASSVTMGSGEVYMGIQRGTIDGQVSGTTAMRDRKMYEVTKYLTVTNHGCPEFLLAINDKSYAKLNDQQKKALTDAAKEVQQAIRDNAKKEDLKALDDLKAKGMEVYVVPEGELQKWRDATKSTWDQFVKETGKTGQELIDICIK